MPAPSPAPTPSPSVTASPSVLIIGSGFGGIAAAVELQRHGHRDITILEGSDGIGGTWHLNTYPGAACDVPSSLYSYTFARGSGWSRFCAPQAEILDYLRSVARRFGVDRLVKLGQQVTSCDWDDTTQEWTVRSEAGDTFRAQVLVIATGQLHQPLTPAFPGGETFAGHAFHSARWDHDHDLSGKRVAVIGNGASAVQFVPEIVKEVGSLSVFQRTGNWFLPRVNAPYSPMRRRIRTVPGVGAVERSGIYRYLEFITASIRHPRTVGHLLRGLSWLYMRRQLRGRPELRRKLWPDYTFGCKRVLFTSHFLKALRSPNADVVGDAITEIVPEGVRTADGTVHEVDTIIYATGFRTTDFMLPMQVTARGRSLQSAWEGGASAHLGITVPGFPSLFLMYGPNTNTSGGSILVFLEAQARYVRTALDHLRGMVGVAALEVKPAVAAASDAALQARFGGTAWLACNSWYRADGGRIVTNWPGYMRDYRRDTRAIDPTQYAAVPAH